MPYYKVLTISGLRQGRYETRYFDTADYEMYTKHHNGKLNRYKVRFRTYVDSEMNFFEVKFKTNTGRTRKSRVKCELHEFNIEGNPKEDKFVNLVLEVKPAQVTLVPDDPGQLTSNHGWDTIKEKAYLQQIIPVFKKAGIRVSIFVDPV